MVIKLLKLTSGEEMVAEIVSENNTEIKIKNPIKFIGTQKGTLVVPFTPLSEDDSDLIIESKHIMFVSQVKDEVEQEYNKVFNKVITPSLKLFTGE